jgi:hypothetical protein
MSLSNSVESMCIDTIKEIIKYLNGDDTMSLYLTSKKVANLITKECAEDKIFSQRYIYALLSVYESATKLGEIAFLNKNAKQLNPGCKVYMLRLYSNFIESLRLGFQIESKHPRLSWNNMSELVIDQRDLEFAKKIVTDYDIGVSKHYHHVVTKLFQTDKSFQTDKEFKCPDNNILSAALKGIELGTSRNYRINMRWPAIDRTCEKCSIKVCKRCGACGCIDGDFRNTLLSLKECLFCDKKRAHVDFCSSCKRVIVQWSNLSNCISP